MSPRALLVAEQRLPGALGVDVNGLRGQLGLHLRRVPARDTERREEPERHCLAVREVVVRRRLERVAEGVAEVQPAARPVVVRILQADPGLVRGGRPHVELPPCQEPRLDELGHPLPPLPLGQRLEQRLVDHDTRRPVERADEVLPSGMSMPVFPPIPASTWPTIVVGTATHGTPRNRSPPRTRRHRSCSRRRARPRCRPGRAGARARAVHDLGDRLSAPAARRKLVNRRRDGCRAPPVRGPRRCPSRCCRSRAQPGRCRARARRAGRGRRARSARRRRRARSRRCPPRPRRPRRGRDAPARRRACGTPLRPSRAGARAPDALPGRVDVDLDQHDERRSEQERVPSLVTAPPPSEITTAPDAASATRAACSSIRRNSASPRSANSSGIVFPARSSIARSRSRKSRPSLPAVSRPNVVFPAP